MGAGQNNGCIRDFAPKNQRFFTAHHIKAAILLVNDTRDNRGDTAIRAVNLDHLPR